MAKRPFRSFVVCLVARPVDPLLACAVSAVIEGIRAYRRASIGNYGAVVVNLEWKLFYNETVWVVVICAIAVLAVIFLMYRFLLKDKLIMELMAEKEVS